MHKKININIVFLVNLDQIFLELTVDGNIDYNYIVNKFNNKY